MFRLRWLLALGLSLLIDGQPTAAQGVTSVPVNFVLDGAIGEWDGLPPAHTEVSGLSTGSYDLWSATSRQGLVIAGRFQVTPWTFAFHFEPFRSGALGIWLYAADPFELPKLEYDEALCSERAEGNSANKVSCLQWVKEQREFRERILRQFGRFWRIAPDGAEEAFATPAYDQLSESQRKALPFPRPAALPIRFFGKDSAGHSTFEILIPWELFPPANRLSLDRIKLSVDIESPPPFERDRKSNAGTSVQPPITTRITTCGQPLPAERFYFLNAGREIGSTFSFGDLWSDPSWSYGRYPPSGFSPTVERQDFFTKELSPGEYLCGPSMSYRRGTISKNFPISMLSPESALTPLVDLRPEFRSTPFLVRRLPDGTRLIRSGPTHFSEGNGRRGWDVFAMSIYTLTPSLQAYEALKLEATRDLPTGYEIEISDDWRTVKEFKQSVEGKWSSHTYCLQGHVYRICQQDEDSPPPKKRLLTQDIN